MKIFFFLLCIVPGTLLAQVAKPGQARVESLENSPARQRLDEIQPYKPVIRRSRTIAVQELETQIALAKLQKIKAEKALRDERKKQQRNPQGAWSAERVAAAEASIDALSDAIDEAEDQLVIAKREAERVQSFFAREKAAGRVRSSAGDGDDDEDEDEDEDEEDGEGEGEGEGGEEKEVPVDSTQSAPRTPSAREGGKGKGRSRTPPPAPDPNEPDIDDE